MPATALENEPTPAPPGRSKVPEVTALFWIIKILATTLGETGGDALSMSMDLGYAVSTAIFAVLFAGFVSGQIAARRFHPALYWATVVATTTLGTTLADLSTRDLGIGYLGGSLLLLALLGLSLLAWYLTLGTVSFRSLTTRRAEMFYWLTILFSQTLGTALGDWVADGGEETPPGLGLGYGGAAAIFGGLLLVILALYLFTRLPRTTLFWSAFILTRPLGAVVGDLLDKPMEHGGMAVSRYGASAVLVVAMVALIAIFKQRPAAQNH